MKGVITVIGFVFIASLVFTWVNGDFRFLAMDIAIIVVSAFTALRFIRHARATDKRQRKRRK